MTGAVTDGAPAPGRPTPVRRRPARRLVVMTAVVVVSAWALAGCASQSANPSVRVSNWVSDVSGGAAIGTLKVDSANVDLALSRHEAPSAVRTVCALLTTDAETAIGNLPAPDDQLTTDLNNAYEKAAAAGDDCYAGAGGAARLLRRSAAERKALLPLLTTAVDRIEAITGRSPSTSTTAPAAGCDDPFASCN